MRMIKLGKAREAGIATYIGDIRSNFKVLVGKVGECTYAYVYWSILLKWIIRDSSLMIEIVNRLMRALLNS